MLIDLALCTAYPDNGICHVSKNKHCQSERHTD